jgi:hypothetical protein
MSHPLPGDSFTVVPDGVAALADELVTLAAELTEDVERTRSAAASFPEALGGIEGWTAGATATSWACLYELLASRTHELAATLTAAAAAYLAEDAWLAGSLGSGRRPR